jgi:hypothetical protein
MESKSTGIILILISILYVFVGFFYIIDPTSAYTPGTDDYWRALAAGPATRIAFLLAFACAGALAYCALPALASLIAPNVGAIRHAAALGQLGFAVTAISYFRVLSGEATRAAAYASGDDAVRKAIASFSISLDPKGWLTFGAVAVCLFCLNAAALRLRTIPTPVALLGLAGAGCYGLAFWGQLTGQPDLTALAAGVGAIGVGPLWWLSLGVICLRRCPRW